jgi:hypothetical protein
MPDKPISLLRQRMIDDMTARRFKEKMQKEYVGQVKTFVAFLGRSPDTPRAKTFAAFSFTWPSNRSALRLSTPPSPRCGSPSP